MHRHPLLFAAIGLILNIFTVHSQEDRVIYVEHNTSSWGYKATLLIPSLRQGSPDETLSQGYPVSYDVNYRAGVKPGISFGIFYETRLTQVFYLQVEIDYQWYQYALDYTTNLEDEYHTKMDADYSIRNSSILVPLLPKVRFGNKYKFYLMAGPYMNIPFSSRISGKLVVEREEAAGKITTTVITGESINTKPEKMEVGLLGGVGVKVPMKTNSLIIELRGGGSLNDVIKQPNYRTTSLSAHIGVIKPLK